MPHRWVTVLNFADCWRRGKKIKRFEDVTNVQQTFSTRDLKTPFRKEMCFCLAAPLVSEGLITSVNLDPTSWPQGHQ